LEAPRDDSESKNLSIPSNAKESIKVGSIVEVRFYVGADVSASTCVWALGIVRKVRKAKFGFENLSEDGLLWISKDRVREAIFSPTSCTREQIVRLMAPSADPNEGELETRSPASAASSAPPGDIASWNSGRGLINSLSQRCNVM
jgi:hypothetical protein